MKHLESLRIRIDAPKGDVETLGSVVNQLHALARFLIDLAKDPQHAKVEVLSISKASPLSAEVRVVNVKPIKSGRAGVATRSRVTRSSESIRRLERTYATVQTGIKNFRDMDGIQAIMEFAADLGDSTATITSDRSEMVVDKKLASTIKDLIGPKFFSRGTVVGQIRVVNFHSRPWRFRIYPPAGPSFIRCDFDAELAAKVASSLLSTVRVHGTKSYTRDSKWPYSVKVSSIDILEAANPGSWSSMQEDMATIWEGMSDEDRETLRAG